MDEERRELERRGDGDVGVRARLLSEKLRRGEIHRSRVALAAHTGNEAARAALGELMGPELPLGDWALGFARWGKEAGGRAALAALEVGLKTDPREPFDPLGAVRDWLELPREEGAAAADRAYFHSAYLAERQARRSSESALAERWCLARAASVLARLPGLERGWSSLVRQAIVGAALGLGDEGRVREAVKTVSTWALAGSEELALPPAPAPREQLLCLSPLGSDVFLPAVLIGWELGGFNPDGAALEVARLDPAFAPGLRVDQQAGGLSMSYPNAVGLLLRLESNLDRLGPRGGSLICGLRAMAEDPDRELLRTHFQFLDEVTLTRGDDYTVDELAGFDDFLEGFVHFPRLAGGLEAFVRFEACRPLDYWKDWNVAVIEPAPGEPFVIDGTHGNAGIDDSRKLDAALLDELEIWGRTAGAGGPPRAFLLWENSD